MRIRSRLTKSRAGHWTMTLVDTETGVKVRGEKWATKHSALVEWDVLHKSLEDAVKARAALRVAEQLL